MVVRSTAAPPTPWSTNLAQPTIHETAFVHSFSNIIGDVRIGPNVLIAPGTSIRADEGSPFYIGGGSNIQDGVVIHGLDQGRVIGDDQNQYSVWIGKHSSITHKALIHGPAYIGDNCFIGFRSTVFNARIGQGSIVMMHALVQDVEIPPGKYVPSGSVITTQQQADRLPDVRQEDMQFAHHVVGVNDALRTGYRCADDVACITPFQNELASKRGSAAGTETTQGSNGNGHYSQGSTQGSTMGLNTDILKHLRQIISGGYRIGTEHIDERRFRTNSWQSCSPIQARSESEAVTALEACLREHQGEYVRLFGIEQKGRQRVLEAIIQRPGANQTLTQTSAGAAHGHSSSSASSHSSHSAAAGSSTDLAQQVRQLLNQGYRLGTEYANARQYKANAWKGGPTLQATRESDALPALELFMAEHAGEYVRLIGIEPKAKRRVAEILIQQPNGKVPTGGSGVKSSGVAASGATSTTASIGGAIADQVQQLLNQGYRIGTEYANARQYKANAWKGGPTIQSTRTSDVVAALESFMAEHAGEYVRLIGIEPKAKRRVSETLIQQPNGKSAPASYSAPNAAPAASSNGSGSYSTASSTRLSSEVVQQIRQILNQGNRVGTEYANARQYKANAWKSGTSFQTSRESEAIAGVEAFMGEHAGEYVRLLGIEPKAKRRVLELLIQQPNGK